MKTDKIPDTIQEVHKAKDTWTLENALQILNHPTVDSKIWAEAVEWLLLYGPPHIQDVLLSASGSATNSCFPDMKSTQFSINAEPCYPIKEIAKALGIDEEEARDIISEKEKTHEVRFSLDTDEVIKKH